MVQDRSARCNSALTGRRVETHDRNHRRRRGHRTGFRRPRRLRWFVLSPFWYPSLNHADFLSHPSVAGDRSQRRSPTHAAGAPPPISTSAEMPRASLSRRIIRTVSGRRRLRISDTRARLPMIFVRSAPPAPFESGAPRSGRADRALTSLPRSPSPACGGPRSPGGGGR